MQSLPCKWSSQMFDKRRRDGVYNSGLPGGHRECVQAPSPGPWASSILTSDKLVLKAKDESGFLERLHSLGMSNLYNLEECHSWSPFPIILKVVEER